MAGYIDVAGTLWLLLLSRQFQSEMQTFRNNLKVLLCQVLLTGEAHNQMD